MRKIVFNTLIVILLTGGCAHEQGVSNHVNPLQGTYSTRQLSNGNTYPAIALPWGMNFWTPQTGRTGSGWQYTYQDSVIRGFKQTHQPSPWINDYGCFSIMPVTGELKTREKERLSGFSHDRETARPHYYSVLLEDYGVRTEIAPTKSGVVFRLSYPKNREAYLVIDGYPKGSEVKVDTTLNRIYGRSKYYAPNNNASLPPNFASHWVVQLPEKPAEYGCWDKKGDYSGTLSKKGDHVGAYVKFNTSDEPVKQVKVASSFISLAQAVLNLERETGNHTFADVRSQAKDQWDRLLGKIQISGGTEEQKRTFYSALYHMYLFPRKMHEFDSEDKMVHYSPLDGKIHSGPFYTDNGFWDTFRAVHPFYTIMDPAFSNGMMESLLNYYREGGWLPEWFSPGYKDCMIGQHSAAVITDAYMKGIHDYDQDLMWEAVVKSANNEGPIEALGRDGIHYYDSLGYIPYDVGISESVSKTLEYAYNDYCIYTLGKAMGKTEEKLEKYLQRSLYYKNVFDTTTNFVRPKDQQGNWKEPFYPDNWAKSSYTEGSAWQYNWSVFHDIEGLTRLMGGKKKLEEKLDSLLNVEPTFRRIGSNKVIHEMTEMVLGGMGQYSHGNQPSQHALYLFNYAGAPYKTQKYVRHVMDSLYSSKEDGFCGDEDNGQTSAWYVFSAMGFYPVTPGTNEFLIGSPLFEEVELKLDNGKVFKVLADNNGPQNKYIQSASLNGEELNRYFITYDEIMEGGTLQFVMGKEPNKKWCSNPQAEPWSLSEHLESIQQ